MMGNESVNIQPVHLKTAETISKAFGVKREVVAEWARNGAPIALIGGKYQADYHCLWARLIRHVGADTEGESDKS